MLTQAEVKKIIEQINESFAEDRQRLTDLEVKVAALEAAKPSKPASKAAKEAE